MLDTESLATQKNFAALNAHERAQVLSEMSAEEYDRLHTLLSAVRSLDADASPPDALGNRLLAHMRQQQHAAPRPRSLMMTLLHLRLPVWQAAAALVLALWAARFFSTEPPVAAPRVWVQTVVQHDTVVQEKIRWRERIVVRWQTVADSENRTDSSQISPNLIEPDPFLVQKPMEPIHLESNPASVGVRLSEQPEWMQFFTRPGEGLSEK